MASNFDFKEFNKMTDDLAVGLKIVLAQSLLKASLNTLSHFDNPLEGDLRQAVGQVRTFVIKYKEAAEARKAELAKPASESTANVAGRGGV